MINEVVSVATGIMGAPVIGDWAANKASELLTKKVNDPKLKTEVENYLISKYGDKNIYNTVSNYLTNNNTIQKLIDMFNMQDTTIVKPIGIFVSDNIGRFGEFSAEKHFGITETCIVPIIFEDIYNIIYHVKLSVNPYSDIGKVQMDMRRFENSTQNEMSKMNNMLSALLKQAGLNVDTLELSTNSEETASECSEKISEYRIKIRNVDKSEKDDYEKIISYKDLLADINTELIGEPQEQISELICTIRCNIAICYSNNGDKENAFNQLSKIPTAAIASSKLYHFVYSLIIILYGVEEEYHNAKASIDKALEIDKEYHRAFLIKSYLSVLLNEETKDNLIHQLDEHFKPIIEKNDDKVLLGDYYIYRGFINKGFNDYESAISDFARAKDFGYFPGVVDYNIGLAYYVWATKNVPKEERVFCPNVDIAKLYNVIHICEFWLIDTPGSLPINIEKQMIGIYVSTCTLVGIRHKLNVYEKIELVSESDYEVKRMLILNSQSPINDEVMDLLNEEDRLWAILENCVHENNFEEIDKLLSDYYDDDKIKGFDAPVLISILQECIISKNTEMYHRYRTLLRDDEEFEIVESLDAYISELEGDIEKAKIVIDKLAKETFDNQMLMNALGFYSRNGFDCERETLLVRMFDLYTTNKIFIADKKVFYENSICFFAKHNIQKAQQFIDKLESDNLQEFDELRIKCQYFHLIFDVPGMYECFSKLYNITSSYYDKYNEIICLIKLMRYEEALNEAELLIETLEEESKEYTQIIWLISDLLLFLSDNDESVRWAQKAHNLHIQHPFEISHHLYLSRLMRTGHTEMMSDIIQYKKDHPVVIDWLKEFQISVDNPTNDLINKLREITGCSPDEQAEKEAELVSLYRSGLVPNVSLLKTFDNDLSKLFEFANKYKLNIAIGSSDETTNAKKWLTDDIVVDSLTLIILQRYNCLSILNNIKNIHITYITVDVLQSYFKTSNYHYVSEILDWLRTADNIVFEHSGYIHESEYTEILSKEFVACSDIAQKSDIPFLCSEPIVSNLKKIELEEFVNLKVIYIPPLCFAMIEKHPDHINHYSQALYDLIKDCAFVTFDCKTILYQIEKADYKISEDELSPFLICNSKCDMISFANVYASAIQSLFDDHYESSKELCVLILNNTKRIWKRGEHYRSISKRLNDECYKNRSDSINQYVIYMIYRIYGVFGQNLPQSIQQLCNELLQNIVRIFGKEYVERITSTLMMG